MLPFNSSQEQQIWIDTDIIFNKPGEEVDNALALMMAFNNTAFEIAGISLIHNVDHGYAVTKKLREFYGDDSIPFISAQMMPLKVTVPKPKQ